MLLKARVRHAVDAFQLVEALVEADAAQQVPQRAEPAVVVFEIADERLLRGPGEDNAEWGAWLEPAFDALALEAGSAVRGLGANAAYWRTR